MVKVVMMGPPGGGKGTQSTRLSNHLKIPHISSGDMMRDIVKSIEQINCKERTDTQKELLRCMETGNLVSNEIICDLVMEKLSSMDSFVLDGFPRNLEQAQLIHELAEIVIYINTELDECVRRIVTRGEGRPDDKQEIAEERMRVYCKETVPAVEYFRDHQNFYEINGNIDKETTTEQIFKIFDTKFKK